MSGNEQETEAGASYRVIGGIDSSYEPYAWINDKGHTIYNFPKPNPDQVHVSILSDRTDAERAILERFDFHEAVGDKAQVLAAFIAEAAVDLARYMRSLEEHPEEAEHFEGLIHTSQHSSNRWVRHYTEWYEDGADIVDKAIGVIQGTDWSGCDLRPVFDPEDHGISFEPFTQED